MLFIVPEPFCLNVSSFDPSRAAVFLLIVRSLDRCD